MSFTSQAPDLMRRRPWQAATASATSTVQTALTQWGVADPDHGDWSVT